ncbi:PKD domain-containing protein [Halomontanus rarus]|uniref:PKD domain-containing protein n=1 Tax=Halomontanus rarus TaxID=3034020 RepID=UPI0023E8097A|nr:PKD domain-containing protein [Halovivax sp. TS33]
MSPRELSKPDPQKPTGCPDVVLLFQVLLVDPELDSTTDPAAAFDVTPADPAVDETVTFDASNATGTIVEYRWDFDFGGTFSADTTADPVTTHAYGESGTRTVALDVENEAGTVDRKTIDVTVTDGSEHASGVDQDVWDAVTDQNGAENELTFQDLVDGIQAYQNDEPVGGLELSYQDLVDLIQWYQQWRGQLRRFQSSEPRRDSAIRDASRLSSSSEPVGFGYGATQRFAQSQKIGEFRTTPRYSSDAVYRW